jgi:hypothetical protein
MVLRANGGGPLRIIGLTGYAGSGKDTVREILEKRWHCTGFAFADPMRAMVHTLLSVTGVDTRYARDRQLKELTIPEYGVSYRHLMQSLGTEWGRGIASDFWLRIAEAYMAELTEGDDDAICVISDVRFANEAAWIRKHGGVIWRVDRPGLNKVRNHVSESEIDTIVYDTVLPNDGTFEDLEVWVGRFIGGGVQ